MGKKVDPYCGLARGDRVEVELLTVGVFRPGLVDHVNRVGQPYIVFDDERFSPRYLFAENFIVVARSGDGGKT